MSRNCNFILIVSIFCGIFLLVFVLLKSQIKLFGASTIFVRTGQPDAFLEQFDDETLKFLLHGMLTQNNNKCSDYRKFGNKDKDGGYQVCMEGRLKPVPGSCNVLSFGISGDWTFDDEIVRYGCNVHSYDPSIGLKDHERSKNHWFHNLGLGKVVEVEPAKNWSMVNIVKALEDIGLRDKTVDVIKVDAEGAEYPFLEDVIENRIDVKQIVLEVHSPQRKPNRVSRKDLLYTINLFLNLQRSDFVISHSFHTTYCCGDFSNMFPREIAEKCCHEVYLYNKNYL